MGEEKNTCQATVRTVTDVTASTLSLGTEGIISLTLTPSDGDRGEHP